MGYEQPYVNFHQLLRPHKASNDTALVREKQKCAMLIQKSFPSHLACNDSLINGLVWGGHKGPQLQGNKKIVSLKQCRESGRKTQENNHRMSNALH